MALKNITETGNVIHKLHDTMLRDHSMTVQEKVKSIKALQMHTDYLIKRISYHN